MEAEAKANLLYRLSCIEGHLRAVKRMVDEDRPCPEVVQQTRALQGSLRQVSVLLVTNHLDHCLRTDATEGLDAARQQMQDELVALFQLESA